MSTVSGIDFLSQGASLGDEVGRIENELGVVLRAAGHGGTDQEGDPSAVARAAEWNILIPTRGSVALTQARTIVGAMASAISARIIVIGRNDASRSQDIRSTIASNVVSGPDGAPVVRSEEITLTGPSRNDRHFGALVKELRLPNLPTATLSIDAAVMDGLVTRELLPLSDRLVIDTGRCEHPDELAVLHRITATGVSELSDLGWERLSGVRQLWNTMFDVPGADRALRDTTRVTIEHRPRHVSSALLFGAWLASQLGWTPIDAKRLGDGQLRFRFTARATDARRSTVELYLGASNKEGGPTGIVAIELRAESKAETTYPRVLDLVPTMPRESMFSLRCTGRSQAEISTPTVYAKSLKLNTRSDLEICIGALGPDGGDPLLREVLAFAARLADRLAERTDRNRTRLPSGVASGA